MTIDDARRHYAIILRTLRNERHMRDIVLAEPRRSQALAEVDAAVTSLEALATVFAQAAVAGVLTTSHEQQPLLDVPAARRPY